MADRVIVVGATRGRQRIPVSEIKQMCGRAGRTHNGSVCIADIVVSMEEEDYVALGMENDDGMQVNSVIGDIDALVFHMMPEVSSGKIRNKSTAADWFNRSFCKAQGGDIDIDGLFQYFEDVEAANVRGDIITSTALGDLASSFYFHPADVLAWKMNFTRMFEEELQDDEVAPAWALGNVPVKRMSGHFGKYAWVISECMDKMPGALSVEDGCVVNTTLWWHCMGGPPIGGMKNAAMALRDDYKRIRAMLGVMNARITKWDRSEWLDGLDLRVMKGLTPELVPLCRIPRIGKGRASFLYNMGVLSVDDLDEDILRIIEGEVDDGFLSDLRRLI